MSFSSPSVGVSGGVRLPCLVVESRPAAVPHAAGAASLRPCPTAAAADLLPGAPAPVRRG